MLRTEGIPRSATGVLPNVRWRFRRYRVTPQNATSSRNTRSERTVCSPRAMGTPKPE